MRIAIASNYYYLKGGAERVLFEEKKILEAHGHQVPVFSQAHPRNEFSPYGDYFPPFKDWRGTRGPAKVAMAKSIMYDRQTARCFLRFLEAAEPDIVHAHNIYGGLTTSILDAARKKHVPVVMTLHDYKLICPSYLMLNRGAVCEDCKGGRFIHCLLNTCHKENRAASGVYCLESYLNRWLHKYDTIRYLICPSMFSLRKHAEHGIPRDRLLHIPNFVNAIEQSREGRLTAEPRYEDGGYALFVGRLSSEKGIPTLLAAAKGLDVPVRLVGDGPLKTEYENWVKNNGMTHVTFEGYKSGADLKRLYENAAFLVLPSQCYENAPMSILEAYACGKPVVGSRIGGIAEMVEHGRTGLQFTPGNADELAECMRTLWLGASLRSQMGLAARDKVEREFSAEAHYEQLMEVYGHLLSESTDRIGVPRIVRNRRDFIKASSFTLLGGIAHHWLHNTTQAGQQGQRVIEPEASDEVLANPGMGFETFNSFNGDEQNRRAENYPQCSIAYFRFYWSKLEPQEGRYNFELIDSLLEKARQKGQDLALRFMPTSAADLYEGTPKWYMEKAKGYWYKKYDRKGWTPEHNDPYFLAKQEELVSAFGQKYNGHQDIVRMEIGSVGFWGEWHMSHTEPAVPMISEENAVKVIDMYLKYWNRTPLSMLIGYVPGLRYAVSKGTGWRADSLGDYGYFSPTWCHMFDAYPQQLRDAGAWDAWKKGPVAFEPPGSMQDLDKTVPEKGGGYDNMWNKALEWHGSAFNAKSRSIYPHQVPSIERFLKKCGYRFVLRRVVLPRTQSPQQRYLRVTIEIENAGVSPVYKDCVLAVKLTGGSGSLVLKAQAKVSAWLPGRHQVEENLPLPDPLGTGRYAVSIGLLGPGDQQPTIRLANKGTDSEGWYPVGVVESAAS